VVGDPHFKTQNIKEIEIFIEKLIVKLEEIKPDIIVVLGDLLHEHERIHISPLNKVYDFIDKLRKITKTYIIVGNHDMISNQVFLEDKHWMNALKEWDNIVIVDDVLSNTINGNKFLFVPYVYPGRFIEAIKTKISEKNIEEYDCIFAHQEFKGCKMGSIISEDGDEWVENYPNVISGHIHCNQRPQKNIYYPGSALQHAFGESTRNVVSLVIFGKELNKNDMRYTNGYYLEEFDLKLPRKRILYCNLEDLENDKIIKELNDNKEDDIKITVSGSYDMFKIFRKSVKYKKILKDGRKLVFKAKKIDLLEQEKLHNDISQEDNNNFHNVLEKLIKKESNNFLNECYECIFKN
jgi:DNA repair exonuclease SbcCD nuclease subunit